ncbi:hypothetical protein D9M68_257720 [compost metagenome]
MTTRFGGALALAAAAVFLTLLLCWPSSPTPSAPVITRAPAVEAENQRLRERHFAAAELYRAQAEDARADYLEAADR